MKWLNSNFVVTLLFSVTMLGCQNAKETPHEFGSLAANTSPIASDSSAISMPEQFSSNQAWDDNRYIPFLLEHNYTEDMARLYPAMDETSRKKGYIDNTGLWVIPPKYDDVPYLSTTASILAVCLDRNWGYIDRYKNWIISPMLNSKEYSVENFNESHAPIYQRNIGYHYVIIQGNGILEDTEDKIHGPFSEGLALTFALSLEQRNKDKDWTFGYTNLAGEWAIPPRYRTSGRGYNFYFHNDLAPLPDGTKMGYINRKGEWAFDARYDEALPFSEGLAAVCLEKKWGYINIKGEIVIKPQFDYALKFSEGLAAVYVKNETEGSGLLGFIDLEGNWVIEPKFDEGILGLPHGNIEFVFQEGLAIAHKGKGEPYEYGNRFGYINKAGEWVIPPEYHRCGLFFNGIAYVVKGSNDKLHCGYINQQGEYIINWEAYPDE